MLVGGCSGLTIWPNVCVAFVAFVAIANASVGVYTSVT
jgi:hypothetical protein